MFIRVSFALIIVLMTSTTIRAQDAKTWRAGVAKTIITPKQYMWMSGYGGRTKPAEGKIHDLWAKALVLEDVDRRRCLLITLDLVGIDKQLADDVCADLQKQFGFQRDQIMLACSHTHCGPVVGKNLIAMYNFDEKQHEL